MAKLFGLNLTNDEYIAAFGNAAVIRYNEHKILPSLVICQAILESGWGCSELATQHGNYHAMNWYNDSVTKKYRHWTMERAPQERDGVMIYQREEFCEFDNLEEELECLYNWYNRNKEAYKKLHGCTNAYECFKLIKEAGYATSSAYTNSLTKIYDTYSLIKEFDNEVLIMAQTKSNTLVKNNIDFANEILKLFNNNAKWTYMYGSTGLVVNEDAKVKNYFDYFKSQGRIGAEWTWENWSKLNDKKQTTDCSNTMNYVLWGKGCNSCYSSNSPKAWVQLDKKQPRIGAVAWREGHVGYIVGVTDKEVIFVHMPSVGRTFEKFSRPIGNDDYWSGYALCPVLDYIDVPTPAAPTPVSVSANIKKQFKVGDIFTCYDADVYVKMSDGTQLKNPAGWTCTPLKVSTIPQPITIAYKNVSCKMQLDGPKTDKYYTIQLSESDVEALKKICPKLKATEVK